MDYAGFAFRMCNPYLRIDLFGFRVPTSWQAGQTGTNLLFLLRVLSAPGKMLVGSFPNPSQNCIRRMQAARSFGTLPFSV